MIYEDKGKRQRKRQKEDAGWRLYALCWPNVLSQLEKGIRRLIYSTERKDTRQGHRSALHSNTEY